MISSNGPATCIFLPRHNGENPVRNFYLAAKSGTGISKGTFNELIQLNFTITSYPTPFEPGTVFTFWGVN